MLILQCFVTDGTYKLKVEFTGSKVYGSYSQSLLLDFGSVPYMECKLHVDVGTIADQKEVEELRKQLRFDHWTEQNDEIIKYRDGVTDRPMDDFSVMLLQMYKTPKTTECINLALIKEELNTANYKKRMHQLLNIEEIQQLKIIDR